MLWLHLTPKSQSLNKVTSYPWYVSSGTQFDRGSTYYVIAPYNIEFTGSPQQGRRYQALLYFCFRSNMSPPPMCYWLNPGVWPLQKGKETGTLDGKFGENHYLCHSTISWSRNSPLLLSFYTMTHSSFSQRI